MNEAFRVNTDQPPHTPTPLHLRLGKHEMILGCWRPLIDGNKILTNSINVSSESKHTLGPCFGTEWTSWHDETKFWWIFLKIRLSRFEEISNAPAQSPPSQTLDEFILSHAIPLTQPSCIQEYAWLRGILFSEFPSPMVTSFWRYETMHAKAMTIL